MPLPTFAFTPAQGFRDSSFAPTDPPSETALRDTMQDIPDQLRDALNGVITTLNSTADGSSGADSIGMTPITGLTATTPQEALEELALKSPINVADNSITNLKLATDVKVGSLATLLTTVKTSVIEAINELFNNKADLSNPTFTSNVNLTTINSKTPSYAVTPTETTIVTGFASGWSGTLTYRVNQENQKILYLALTKSTDITSEVVYTLPPEVRPSRSVYYLVNLFNSGGSSVANSFAVIYVRSDNGQVSLVPVAGTTLTNARLVLATIPYY